MLYFSLLRRSLHVIEFVKIAVLKTRFSGTKVGLFSRVGFMISWPSRVLHILHIDLFWKKLTSGAWLLSIWFQVSWHHTLKYRFLNDLNQQFTDSLQMCLEFLLTLIIDVHIDREFLYIQIFPAWKLESLPKSHLFVVSWYQRYISLPYSSFLSRWNLEIIHLLLQVFVNCKHLLYRLVDCWQCRPYDNNLTKKPVGSFFLNSWPCSWCFFRGFSMWRITWA